MCLYVLKKGEVNDGETYTHNYPHLKGYFTQNCHLLVYDFTLLWKKRKKENILAVLFNIINVN